MPLSYIFWILMLLWLLWSLPFNKWGGTYPYAGNLLLFVLFGLLGWQVFGAAVK